MKQCRWLTTLLVLLLTAGMNSPAVADWVEVGTPPLVITESAPTVSTTGGPATVKVTIWNSSDEDIDGKLRLVVDDGQVPSNALLAGEEGSDPTPYFELSTLEEDFFNSNEATDVYMVFDSLSDAESGYTLSVQINDESVSSEIFRKKISKTPERYSGEALMKLMEVYVPARSTKGLSYIRDTAGELVVCCAVGEVSEECVDCSTKTEGDFAKVKPLIVSYIEEEEDVLFNNVPDYDANGDGYPDPEAGNRYARDVHTAVSLDDGLTWKRTNLSRTAVKSSYTIVNGVKYPGDSESQDLTVAGHYALVTWVDKYCHSNNPWDLEAAEDLYQVMGDQRSKDYLDVKGDEDPRPDLGERPFSCVMAARGVLQLDPESADYGEIVWYKPQQLSTGRRDAIHNFTAAVEPVYDGSAVPIPGTGGFAVTWQEDPGGLKTGHGRGPGAGMTGASTNHKTDIWYSYIGWDLFDDIDTAFVPTEGGDEALPIGDADGNSEYVCPTCGYVYDPEVTGVKFTDLDQNWVCPEDGTPKSEFVKVSRPHALHTMSPPVPITDNAVCREKIEETVVVHVHTDDIDCNYSYEGGTNSEPLLWEDLPAEWKCPKCGAGKDTFTTATKTRNIGAPYCDQFAANPRVDGDGKYAKPDSLAADVAFYSQDGDWKDANGNFVSAEPGDATIKEDGTAVIGDTRVYWSGEPLDGNTGASRANLALVNHNNQTLALVAYEETKGVGVGGDKVAAAMEQKAPYPLVKMGENSWEAGAINSDCRSCHYGHEVPRDRYIPVANKLTCEITKGGIWKGPEGSETDGKWTASAEDWETWLADSANLPAYYPYTGYPYLTDAPVAELPAGVTTYKPGTETEVLVPCIKYVGGKGMFARDVPTEQRDPDAYYDLPDHMPGWHQEALSCTDCHLPYNTKDLDKDGVMDRVDLCLMTPADEIYLDSETYLTSFNHDTGCSESQDPTAPDNNKDAVKKYRHGKNVYYHHFDFAHPEAIDHGDQINLPNDDAWVMDNDDYENARRVRLVINEAYDPAGGADVTLGLLYKEGKDGQGAPADAMLRLFRNGFEAENLDPKPLNMSSSTAAWFKDPADVGNVAGTGDNAAGDGSDDLLGNRNTPSIDHYYWTDANLDDTSGFWLEDGGDKQWKDDGYTPNVDGNPFENVFSARLEIRGNTIVTGFAHCANWSAGKKAKDYYDFYVRVSRDSGRTWTLPYNVSKLRNHEESVSDCRVILTPETIDQQYPAEPGNPADISMNGAAEVFEAGDFNNPNILFVGIGTKVNSPQLYPSEDEEDEVEIFKDVFYSKGTITGTTGGEGGNLALTFETEKKENPQYDPLAEPPSKQYLDSQGLDTELAEDPYTGIPNKPNPAYGEFIDGFDWMAQGDANQGDVQFGTNPFGTKLYTTWEQELPIVEDDGQQHFQGSDVWFRKVPYPDPGSASDGDVDGDGDTDWDDGLLITDRIGTTAYDTDFLWAGDYISDFRITGHDFNRWKVQYAKEMLKQKRLTVVAE
ncbi:rubredoxin [Desulfoprunum benzoelyticum]|uniref:Rubredoxin n=1 Tax=Desulfoprunum benzoelyticum TaxID=1506996 RepID=A0A840UX75_9BACT|nr:choice-of-anchor O protein [Desulfoprunum benzoelyticum]MBB5347288.1 rubredoxin [Desulfoprunum benzoelyticum]MBM9531442.1 rubredoxin [Desulfoprunum benzoelyticum]